MKRGAWIAGVAAAALLLAAGCTPPPPKVICEMVKPQTGEHARLFEECWFKVPAGYDERRHVATWRAEQIAKGFTVEVAR